MAGDTYDQRAENQRDDDALDKMEEERGCDFCPQGQKWKLPPKNDPADHGQQDPLAERNAAKKRDHMIGFELWDVIEQESRGQSIWRAHKAFLATCVTKKRPWFVYLKSMALSDICDYDVAVLFIHSYVKGKRLLSMSSRGKYEPYVVLLIDPWNTQRLPRHLRPLE